MSNVSIDYAVVGEQVTTMEELATSANNLQSSLDGLKSSLSSNWNGGGAEALLNNFDEFVGNIQTVTNDITAIKQWCEDTVASFKKTTGSNEQAIQNAMSGK